MAEASRSEKTVVNMTVSITTNIITQALNFIVRTVFIYMLNKTYLGIDTLFGNILTILSLADLGIGVAMAHTYYKPLAEKNEEKIAVLTQFYSKIYYAIGLVVFFAGMCIMPFLPKIIKDIDKVEALGLNLYFIYFWYVLRSAITYACAAHKQTLIIADQKQYVIKGIYMWFSVATTVVQIAFLVIFRGQWFSYYVYLITNILFQLVRNLYAARKCDKMYPYIKIKSKAKMLREDIHKLITDVCSLFVYRVCIVVMSAINPIIISIHRGVDKIGDYSNYNYLIGAVQAILSQIFETITASVGNLVAQITGIGNNSDESNDDRAYKTFNALYFAGFYLFGMCSVVLWAMLDPFVRFWLGDTDIVFISPAFIFVLIANFYVMGVQMSTTSFRNAYGLFKQGWFRPVVMAILNVVLAWWWVQDFGEVGVFAGALVSRLLTMSWFDPYVVHKYGFKHKFTPFIIKYIWNIALLISLGWFTEWVLDFLPAYNLPWLFLRGILAVIISNSILLISYFRSEEMKFIMVRAKMLFGKFLKKKSNN